MQENWIGRSEGAEVVFRCEELGIDYPVFTTRPDTLFGATFFVMAPEHPDVFRLNDSPEVHEYVNHAVTRVRGGARRRARAEDGRGARPHGDQPGHGRADPDVRSRLRVDGVRHRGDHGRARPRRARLRVRPGLRPADRAGDRGRRAPLRRRRTDGELGPLRRDAQPRGLRADRRVARIRGQGQALGQLPPARLAALAPALLGLPDPDRPLRRVRPRGGAGRGPARRAAGRRRLPPAGQVAAGRRRGLGQRAVPEVRW